MLKKSTLTIHMEMEQKKCILKLEGRIDTLTAPDLEKAVNGMKEAEDLVMDFEKVEYMSSAGIRVIIAAYKKLLNHLRLIHVNDEVYSVLFITGIAEKIEIEGSGKKMGGTNENRRRRRKKPDKRKNTSSP